MAECGLLATLAFLSCVVFINSKVVTSAALHTQNHDPESRSGEEHGPKYRCGDNRCLCFEFTAECNGTQLQYIPELPANVSTLKFGSNNIRSNELTASFFSNASNVRFLDLTFNRLTYIPCDALRLIQNLTTLLIVANKRFQFDSFVNLLKIPSLRGVGAYGCSIVPPRATHTFRSIDSDVDTLWLGGNQFHTGNLTEFVSLKRLKFLGLSENRISHITLVIPIGLKHLSLAGNNLDTFPPTADTNGLSLFPNMDFLDLTYNQIVEVNISVPIFLKTLWVTDNVLLKFPRTCIKRVSLFPYLRHLKIDKNHIKWIPGKICLPELTQLDLSSNALTVISPHAFNDRLFPSLRCLKLGHQSPPPEFSRDGFHNSQLVELSMEYNSLSFSDPDFQTFASCPNLTVLILDGNNFEDVSDRRFQELLGHLPLVTLSIKQGHVNIVPKTMILHLSGLVKLDLGNNKIATIPGGTFDLHQSLRFLDISHNKLSVVSQETFGENRQHQLEELSLGSNPFVCSCDLLWFQSWLNTNHTLFYHKHDYDLPQYQCNNIPEMRVENFTIAQQACLLNTETSIQITVVLTLIILAFTFSSLSFRYRWHIRLILYEGFRARNDVRRLRLLADNFDYDVFVSYASEDLPWVRQHLMPELEDRLGLRLCVHERDFIPGKNIVDNIADCVESSKKILMVFSTDFVRSHWCQFELTFCLSHAMDHYDVLIIVCVDDVASREMTSAMMAVLKTTTFIQWAGLADAIDAFWGRVYMSLNEVIEPRNP